MVLAAEFDCRLRGISEANSTSAPKLAQRTWKGVDPKHYSVP